MSRPGHDVFLSHNRRDAAAIERVAERLRRRGLEPWMDRWALTDGGRFDSEIEAAIASAGACAVFIGPHGLGEWQRLEMELAIRRAEADGRFRVFPVLLPGLAEPFDPSGLHPRLRTRTWVDMRTGVADERALDRLGNAISGRAPGPAAPLDPTVCPYRGLEAFQEGDADLYVGREAEVQRAIERLRAGRFLAVIGPSGSGKSSLLRAGVLPALRRGGVPGSEAWDVRVIRPGADPPAALRAEGAEKADAILVDQLEEVFTLCRDEGGRAAFLDALVEATWREAPRTVVVVALRADFYSRCAAHPQLAAAIAADQLLLGAMDGETLRRVIEEPARRVGLGLEEGLAEQIVREVGTDPGALPLLEHVLLELWERRTDLLTRAAYREAGGVQGSLAARAEGVYESMSEEERAVARGVLLRLVQPGEGAADTRRRALASELSGRSAEPAGVEAVVAALSQARLLSAGWDAALGEPTLEIAHEALMRGWPRLRGWIDEDRQALLAHRRLGESAREWVRSGRSEDLLPRGLPLAEGLALRERDGWDVSPLEAEFLAAGADRRRREEAVRRRRLRVLVGALIAVVAIVSTVAAIAVHQERIASRERNVAVSGELAARAGVQLAVDPELSLLLALEAAETARTPQAIDSLRRALAASSVRLVLRPGAGAVDAAAYSPDGRLVATGSEDGSVRLWRASDGALVARSPGDGGGAGTIAFSRDGNLLVSGSEDGAARVWRASDGALVSTLRSHRQRVAAAALSPDGRLAATASDDGSAALWRATDGRRLAGLPGGGEPVAAVAFSPDGRLLATGGDDFTVRLWRAADGAPRGVLRGHGDSVGDIAFSPDGRRLVSSGWDGRAIVWDAAGGRALVTLGADPARVVRSSFDARGRRILTIGSSGTARIWDARTGRVLHTLRSTRELTAGGFSSDGARVLTASADGAARVWDAADGRRLRVLRGHTGLIAAASFAPRGDEVLTAGLDGTARVWAPFRDMGRALDAHSGGVLDLAPAPGGRAFATAGVDGDARLWRVDGAAVATLRGDGASVRRIVASRDGSVLATGDARGAVRLWRAADGERLAELGSVAGEVLALAISGDGGTVLAGTSDGALGLWREGRRAELPPHDGPALAVAVTNDGAVGASAGVGGVLRVWDLDGPRQLAAVDADLDGVAALALDPDDRRLLTGGLGGAVTIRDLRSGRMLLRLVGHRDAVFDASFSADGRLALTAGRDGTARVFDAATGAALAELRGHSGGVAGARFHPDGSLVVTGGQDGTVRVWDAASGRQVEVVANHRDAVTGVAFDAAGREALSASLDGQARISPCALCRPDDELIALARARVTRELTDEERAGQLRSGR